MSAVAHTVCDVFFSQTWLRYVWLILWQIRPSVCRLSVTCVHPTQEVFAPYWAENVVKFIFIVLSVHLLHKWRWIALERDVTKFLFLHHIVAWPSGNSTTKNHEDRLRGSPPLRGLNRKGWSNRRIWHIAANISLLIYYTAIDIQLENK